MAGSQIFSEVWRHIYIYIYQNRLSDMIHTHLPSGSEKVSLGELASGLSLSLSLSLSLPLKSSSLQQDSVFCSRGYKEYKDMMMMMMINIGSFQKKIKVWKN